MWKKTGNMPAYLLILTLSASVLAGCGDDEVRVRGTGVQLEKNGSVTGVIVEDFDRDYYTVGRLLEMIEAEMNSYNSLHGEAVSLESAEMSETQPGKVVVTMRYADVSDYAQFNEVIFFDGTVAEALSAGYVFPETLVQASDADKRLGAVEAAQLMDRRVLIFEEDMQASVTGKILYLSEGAQLLDKRTLQAPDGGGCTYVIYK